MRIQWLFASLALVLVSHGCGDSGTTGARGGCSKDTDCKGDRICVAGACVSESGDSGANPADASSSTGGSRLNTGGSRSNTGGTGGRVSVVDGQATTGGRSTSAGGAGTGGGSDAASPGGTGGNAVIDAAPPGPECTMQDTSACTAQGGLPTCCTFSGNCGVLTFPFGCIAVPSAGDGGPRPGAGGATGGGGLISPACKTCRATSCSSEVTACNANAGCKTLSTCIDTASPFNLLNCLTGVTAQARTLYNALSTCASGSCTGCPNINL